MKENRLDVAVRSYRQAIRYRPSLARKPISGNLEINEVYRHALTIKRTYSGSNADLT